MDSLTLASSTGHAKTDAILRGIIGLFEIAFPGRIRGCYLVGSYADGSAVPGSDIDLRVVFKGGFRDEAEEEQFRYLRQQCRLISPVAIDLPPLSEARLTEDEEWLHETLGIKTAGRFLYGEDIRDRLPVPDSDAYARNVTGAPVLFLPRLHRREAPLISPLEYPDPAGEFYGYEAAEPEVPATKMLVHVVGFIASCRLALKAGCIVTRKSDWLPLYQAHLHDEWTPLLEAIYRHCKQEWQYRIPEGESDRRTLRRLCGRILAFENDYLAHYREYLLTHLRSERREHRLFAARRLQDVVYPELRAALEAAEAGDKELCQAIESALQVYRQIEASSTG